MPTLNEVLQSATDLAPAEVEWLQLLVGDWQLISDLSFGDLVLWVPGGIEGWLRVSEPIERCRMVGIAQVGLPERPGMLKAISEHHHLDAGIYATVEGPGSITLGDAVTVLDD